MPAGILAAVTLAANTDTELMTGLANTVTTVSVNLCNIGAAAAAVRVALFKAGGSGNKNIEFDFSLSPASAPLERTGIVLGPGDKLIVRADTNFVDAVCYGFPEAA